MKKFFNIWLMAALILGLGMSVTSCNDDDNMTEEQKQEKAHEKASAFWDVVAQLVSVDDVTDDYEGKTFEPTIGIADSSDPLTRIVNTNDMKTAVMRFANLVGATGIDENTPSYTWSDPEVGTMTYTRGGTAAEWATVDVDIKAVPHLQKIIYRAGGEGDNGSFDGRAYYRFGDVVSRQVTVTYNEKKNNDRRGTITEYWICVRPAFGPEGKEDSHWVCVNTVGDKNYKYYKASTGKEYWLPTSLGTNKENMQNLAEMLYAICYPGEWFNNVLNFHEDGTVWGFSGLPFFTDFKGKNLKYHNEAFWQNVQKGWEDKQVAEKALNMPHGGLSDLVDKINSNGIHLLYKGYSWWFTTSWNCQLWEAVYTNGTTNAEKNLHHAVYNEEVERNMKDLTFDVRTMGEEVDNYKYFFNNDGKLRWVIRHATGKELASDGKFDVQQPIQGVTEVYRYYAQYPDEWTRQPEEEGKPEITKGDNANNDRSKWKRTEFTGRGFYNWGDVYKDEQGYFWFVISMAGRDKGNPTYDSDDPNKAKESSPVAELVSFNGLTANGNKSQVTNLPTLDQAVRATFFLHTFFANSANYTDNNMETQVVPRVVKNIIDHAGVDLRRIFQGTAEKADDHQSGGRKVNHLASVAYRDAAVADGQPLVRVQHLVGLSEATNQNPPYHFWKNYVANPDGISTSYKSDAFGQERILLQHIAKQDYVTKYAKDYYACQPLWPNSGGDFTTPRTQRTQPDARAENVTNYYYDKNAFNGFTFPGDMWNSPVLMFRATAVYDRGKDDHATVTLDGHTLTLVKTASHYIIGSEYADDQRDLDENYYSVYGILTGEAENMSRPSNYLNGALFTPPTWQQAWQW